MAEKKNPLAEPTDVLHKVTALIDLLDFDSRSRIVETLAAYYAGYEAGNKKAGGYDIDGEQAAYQRGYSAGIEASDAAPYRAPSTQVEPTTIRFTEDRTMSLPQFIREKHPLNDAEAVACIAYYLKYYRDLKSFSLNQLEAACKEVPRFLAVKDTRGALAAATRRKWIEPRTSDVRRITVTGTRIVQALPHPRGETKQPQLRSTRRATVTRRKR